MKKSVYSLVLMDDVVTEVDRLAYSMNTSRSNLINQILAQYVAYTTPQQQMKNMFSQLEKTMEGLDFQIKPQLSESMILIHSALSYKYNPSIRYSVELLRNADPAIGVLKVFFRTQNKELLGVLKNFFNIWFELEKKYNPEHFAKGKVSLEPGGIKYIREFILPKQQANSDLAPVISEYIRMFDSNLKIYFKRLGNTAEAEQLIEKLYREAISNGI